MDAIDTAKMLAEVNAHWKAEIATLTSQRDALLEACYFMRDFYHMDTKEFVDKWGHGHTTKSVGDKARAAITAAEAGEA